MTSARIKKWPIILSGYDYTLSYRSGHQSSNADCMSELNFNLKRETEFSTMDNRVFDRIRTCPRNFKGGGIFY